MDRDQGWLTAGRAKRRLTPSERFACLGYIFGGLFTIALAFDVQLYRPEGRPMIIGAGLGLAVLGLFIAWRRRETSAQRLAQSLFTIGMVGVCAQFVESPIMATTMASALGMVTLTAAAHSSRGHTYIVMALATVAGLWVVNHAGASGWAAFGVSGMIVSLCVVPAIVILSYRRQLEDALERVKLLATTDVLTGLANRRGMTERVPALFAEAQRSGRAIGVLMADVDHFKQFNDRFGHLAGDEALRAVADLVRGAVRQTDLVARFGGEEICVVAAVDRSSDFTVLGERIRKNVEADSGCGVTVSLGGYFRPPSADVPALQLFWSMVGLADEQLYEAKDAGRNTTRVQAQATQPIAPAGN